MLAAARGRYLNEANGRDIHVDLRRLAQDQALIADVRADRLHSALTEANRQLVGHIVRIRISRGPRILVDANPASFAVRGASTQLRDHHGRVLATLTITIQDVIGFIKLNYRQDGAAATVVRAAGGRVLTLLPGAARQRLPRSGCVRVSGRSYVVRSFAEHSFTGEALTVWLLVAV